VPRFFRLPLTSRPAVSADVDEEIRVHLEARVSHLVASGLSPDEARRVALQRFGDVETTRRAMRGSAQRYASRLRRRDRLSGIAQDARHTVRQLRRSPGLTAVIVITLGLGIGATAMMFGLVDRLLFRPPAHVRNPESLGRLYTSHLDGENQAIDQDEISYLRYTQLRDGVRPFADVAAMGGTSVNVGRGTAARRVAARFVSGNFWTVLGVTPSFGRFFGPDEDRPPDGSDVVVLGNAYWRTRLGGDSAVVGQQLDIGTRRFTVVGIAPPDFQGVTPARVDVWLPVTTLRARDRNQPADWYAKNNFWWLELVARLRPAATPAQAEAALTATFTRVNLRGNANDATVRKRARVAWGPLLAERGPRREASTPVAAWLAVIAGLVLLLACSNVANLLLARAIRRRREIAVRVALGLSRPRLLAQLLVEGVILATAGSAVGVAIAFAGGRTVGVLLIPSLAPAEQVFNGRVLAFAMAAAVVVGLLASMAPALWAMRQDISTLVKTGSGKGSSRRPGLRTILLAGQCALSTTLLLGAGLFIRSLQNARSIPLGYDAPALLVVTAEQRDPGPMPGGSLALYREFVQRLRGMPGVVNAATTNQIPFSTSSSTEILVPGRDSAFLARLEPIMMNPVGEGYFETMGTRIIRGRALEAQDGAQAQRVIVVSDSMAKALWAGENAIGKCVKVGGRDEPCSVVVGVAENVHQYDVRAEPAIQYWFPESQNQGGNSGARAVMIRTTGDARVMMPALRRTLQSMVPASIYVTVWAVPDAVDRIVRPWRIGAMLLTAFGVLGLIIAGMGLYSALAYSVSQRSAELGIRIALGATPLSVIIRVVLDGMRVVLVGIAAGIIIALAAGRSIDSILLGVTTIDPRVLPATIATLLAAALLASALPAWRASRVDPAEALRAGD
jgi:predicted permease